jgi:hypothetical protein
MGTISRWRPGACSSAISRDHIVRRQEDGGASLPDVTNQLTNEARGYGVEAGCRFVQEDQLRTMQECTGERQPPTHALRELADELVAILMQADPPQKSLRSFSAAAMKAREQTQVLKRREF